MRRSLKHVVMYTHIYYDTLASNLCELLLNLSNIVSMVLVFYCHNVGLYLHFVLVLI